MGQDTWKGSPWQPWTQNAYSYLGGNPVNDIDPTGHCGVKVCVDGGESLPDNPVGAAIHDAATILATEAAMTANPVQPYDWEAAVRQAEALSDPIVTTPRKMMGEVRADELASGGLGWPLPSENKTITSGYGLRIHPIKKKSQYHSGVDIGAEEGTPVYAVAGGTAIVKQQVDDNGHLTGYGNYIIIDHGTGYFSLYAHLSSTLVMTGQSVYKGDTIGKVGQTGGTTGPHLHFEYGTIKWDGDHETYQLTRSHPLDHVPIRK